MLAKRILEQKLAGDAAFMDDPDMDKGQFTLSGAGSYEAKAKKMKFD